MNNPRLVPTYRISRTNPHREEKALDRAIPGLVAEPFGHRNHLDSSRLENDLPASPGTRRMIADAPTADLSGKVAARMSRVKRSRPDWRGEEVVRTVRPGCCSSRAELRIEFGEAAAGLAVCIESDTCSPSTLPGSV